MAQRPKPDPFTAFSSPSDPVFNKLCHRYANGGEVDKKQFQHYWINVRVLKNRERPAFSKSGTGRFHACFIGMPRQVRQNHKQSPRFPSLLRNPATARSSWGNQLVSDSMTSACLNRYGAAPYIGASLRDEAPARCPSYPLADS